MQYSPSNCFSILLDTPRACPSYDFIVKAISSCIAFICLVIVAAWLSRLFRAKFSLLFRKINIKNDQFHCFYVQHIVEQSRQVMSMLTINIILCSLATPYNTECFTQKFRKNFVSNPLSFVSLLVRYGNGHALAHRFLLY